MRTRKKVGWISIAGLLALGWASAAAAQEHAAATAAGAASEGEEMQKKLVNPVSDLVSVPFQFNWAQDVGPYKDTQFLLNIQPVMPFTLTKDANLILRVIVPLVSQPALTADGTPTFGVSDVLTSFFYSPSKPSSFIWGVGPVVSFPSTAEPTLGTGKWSVGPTFVVLKQSGRWTVGMLANQLWSIAGNADRQSVSQLYLQPFFAYNTKTLWTFVLNSEATANWEADTDKWTVPINLMISKLSSFGPFPASYMLGVGVYPVHPSIGPTWKIRGAITILLPRRK